MLDVRYFQPNIANAAAPKPRAYSTGDKPFTVQNEHEGKENQGRAGVALQQNEAP
jgi:hypothetical protein